MTLRHDAPLPPSTRARTVTAVVGPTNTGKTHLAIERMLGHETGVIGLPLRLLAREVYSRVVERVGEQATALVTGEEKLVPDAPRYWVCTVEAMPPHTDAAFVAIDEVQLAGDLERGHVFTDRLMNLRGTQETLLLGAATIRPLLERLLPGLNVVTRPRMSQLTYAGSKKITRLPAKSAIVAFSADEVYAIAELIRRQRGGAAVVLGSLSPRTRNAQVELFQNGDVEFLVATDAIGMGLNLDIDHIAFAADRKFDGYQFRRLTAAEMGQIAGRAGRHMRDGTFGVTARVDPLSDDLVEVLESHAFQPLKMLQWRNRDLDYSTATALRTSLDVVPREDGLTRAPPSDDVNALDHALRDPEITDRLTSPHAVELLWDVCKIPDYRKIAPANHAELITTMYMFLRDDGHISDDWLNGQLAYADRIDGDIDTLSSRIAHIRTWTYVANRADWLNDPDYWRDRARQLEDRLSDALHERLTQRFVDRRTSVLMKRLRENAMLETEITSSGDVVVEGQHVGQLQGFRFTPDSKADGQDGKAIRAAAQKALAGELVSRAERLAKSANDDFVSTADCSIRWRGELVARLSASENILRPGLIILSDEHLTGAPLDRVRERIQTWVEHRIKTLLGPLMDLSHATNLDGIARGVAFRLVESFGVVDRREIAEEVRQLDQDTRAILRNYGVRFGAYSVFIPALLKPGPSELLANLWALVHGSPEMLGLRELPQLSASGRTSIPVDEQFEKGLYGVVGFRLCGRRAVRIDILERLADQIRPLLAWRPGTPANGEQRAERPDGAVDTGGAFTVTVAMTSLLGCAGDDFSTILKSLGYRAERREIDPPSRASPAPETPDRALEIDSPTNVAGAPEVSSQAAAETVASKPDEPVILEIWRAPRPPRVAPRARAGKSANAPKTTRAKRSGGPKSRANDKAKPKQVQVDPDSPFAALAQIRARLEASDGGS
jgi:ATP-dependent RNA helicase SUPV3L1/SUV3